MIEQGSLDWHRERLGLITASRVGDLMGTIKRDKEGKLVVPAFAKTAMSYMHEKAAERGLMPSLVEDDQLFEKFLQEQNYTTWDMRRGTETEELARWVYAKRKGYTVEQVGLQKYKDLLGDSPDGLILFEREIGSVEIKCPKIGTHNLYCTMVEQQDLMRINQDYYIQCQCHILANNCSWCDFVSFDPRQRYDLHVLRILPDQEVIDLIIRVCTDANKIITSLVRE